MPIAAAATMMRKKVNYTNITPIPAHIPRQLAIDILQSHGEVIELSPLVTGFEGIKAPRDAPSDEFYATWYEISQRIQYIPGIGKLGSGSIKFKGCFHDMPWGLQTHVYAPAGVDLRNKWQICGNQPGEPIEPRELGIGAPPDGLYLREDIEIKCNVTMVSFVKKENKAASKTLVDRLIKKAELLDAGVLQGMMNKGKLVTHNPADRSSTVPNTSASPRLSHGQPQQQQQQQQSLQPYTLPRSPTRSKQPDFNHHPSQTSFVTELPGDYYHPAPSAPISPGLLHPSSTPRPSSSSSASPHSHNPRWSQTSADYASSASSRPSSYAPSEGASGGMRSPGLEAKPFAAELPTMAETREEHGHAYAHSQQRAGEFKYEYDPRDFQPQPQELGHGHGGVARPRSHDAAAFPPPPLYSAYNPQGR